MSSPAASPPSAAPTTIVLHYPGGPLHAVQSLLYIIVVAIFIVAFTVQPFQIPSGSMEPTLLIGDFLLVNKQLVSAGTGLDPLPRTSIHRGDIIVFHYPVEPTLHLVKRVIGLPGDRVRLREGRVYINDRLLEEPYTIYRASGPDSFRDNFPRTQSAEAGIDSHWWIEMHHLIDHGNLIVPAGHYFVLGDNRNNSEDSRYWGFVPQSAIVGKPFVVYFSVREAERSDPAATAELKAPLRSEGLERHIINHLADFARWNRVFRVIH